jgi:hypothetical protein
MTRSRAKLEARNEGTEEEAGGGTSMAAEHTDSGMAQRAQRGVQVKGEMSRAVGDSGKSERRVKTSVSAARDGEKRKGTGSSAANTKEAPAGSEPSQETQRGVQEEEQLSSVENDRRMGGQETVTNGRRGKGRRDGTRK